MVNVNAKTLINIIERFLIVVFLLLFVWVANWAYNNQEVFSDPDKVIGLGIAVFGSLGTAVFLILMQWAFNKGG
jgi:hypothetical protein